MIVLFESSIGGQYGLLHITYKPPVRSVLKEDLALLETFCTGNATWERTFERGLAASAGGVPKNKINRYPYDA